MKNARRNAAGTAGKTGNCGLVGDVRTAGGNIGYAGRIAGGNHAGPLSGGHLLTIPALNPKQHSLAGATCRNLKKVVELLSLPTRQEADYVCVVEEYATALAGHAPLNYDLTVSEYRYVRDIVCDAALPTGVKEEQYLCLSLSSGREVLNLGKQLDAAERRVKGLGRLLLDRLNRTFVPILTPKHAWEMGDTFFGWIGDYENGDSGDEDCITSVADFKRCCPEYSYLPHVPVPKKIPADYQMLLNLYDAVIADTQESLRTLYELINFEGYTDAACVVWGEEDGTCEKHPVAIAFDEDYACMMEAYGANPGMKTFEFVFQPGWEAHNRKVADQLTAALRQLGALDRLVGHITNGDFAK